MNGTTTSGKILVGIKTPFMPRSLAASLQGHETVSNTLVQVLQTPPKDPASAEVLQQLALETSGGDFHFLTINKHGEAVRIEPSTQLHEIAVPREIRTARGIEMMPTVAIEVQSYAKVGAANVSRSCASDQEPMVRPCAGHTEARSWLTY